jgi:CspA family cold shock protein
VSSPCWVDLRCGVEIRLVRPGRDQRGDPGDDFEQQPIPVVRSRAGRCLQLPPQLLFESIRHERHCTLCASQHTLGVFGAADEDQCGQGGKLILVDHRPRRPDMAQGKVKFLYSQKGFGFIQPTDGGPDVFVHISAVERAGMSNLNEGQTLTYDVVSERGKLAASNLQNV